MQNLKRDYFNPFFSHIYVEKKVRDHPRTKKILDRFPRASVIEIGHYKDVFCRGRQSGTLQRRTQKLILAAKEGTLLYPGASVCQSFGNKNFYYTSCVMNCIYDCTYCYLKGMYPSANIVIFVNIEDIFAGVVQMLQKFPLYLCVSYDTDLLALESVVGYAGAWNRFAAAHEADVTIEIRTKCAGKQFFRELIFQNFYNSTKKRPLQNVIYAFTLSPQDVIKAFEHGTPSLSERIACAKEAADRGFPVRLCFDPMIYIRGWQRSYGEMLEEVFCSIKAEQLLAVSVGSFRIPQDYLKKMRRQEPDCAAAWFPYEIEHGVCHYPTELMEQMEQYLAEKLKEKLPEEKIFLWNKGETCSNQEKKQQ